jgi:hypothetical protein
MDLSQKCFAVANQNNLKIRQAIIRAFQKLLLS